MSLLAEILGLGAGGGLVKGAYDRLGNIGDSARNDSLDIAQKGVEQTQFKPFTVSTGLGNVQTDAQGGFTTNLNAQQQGLQNQLGQGASNFFSQATGSNPRIDPGFGNRANNIQNLVSQGMERRTDANEFTNIAENKLNAFQQGNNMLGMLGQGTGQREADVFERLRALQRPGEERQRLGLEERQFNQGRGGVRTSMFGGTPEQFAMEQAQGESRNQAALMALQQAQQEQSQQANIGSTLSQLGQQGATAQEQLASQNINNILGLNQGANQQRTAGIQNLMAQLNQQQQNASLGGSMMQNQFMPQANMLNALGQGGQLASIADIGRRQGANLYGSAAMGGLEAQLGAGLGQANMMGQMGTGLLSGMLTPRPDGDGGFVSGIDTIRSKLPF